MNITTLEGFEAFKESVCRRQGSAGSRVDLVLSCVDNYEARMTINQVRARTAAASAAPRPAQSSRLSTCMLEE